MSKTKNVTKVIYTCPNCKSRKVLVLAWINPNTEKVSDYRMYDEQDMWCTKCQEHVELNSKLYYVAVKKSK